MRPVRLLAAALLIASVAGAGTRPLLAQDGPSQQGATSEMPGTDDVSAISGGTYAVDTNHTQIVWTVDHMGISPLAGMFGVSAGTLVLDPAKPDEARLEITIPLSGLRVTSESFGRDLAGPGFFDVEKFPAATFRSTSVTSEGTDATIEGELTLHGVTRPVTLDVSFFGAGINPRSKVENIGFTATAEIERSAFGLGGGIPLVSDTVALDIVGAFIKQP